MATKNRLTMTKAEQAALIAYPVNKTETSDSCEIYDANESNRSTYQEGYEQAEKDLALTDDDIRLIFNKVRIKQFLDNTTEGFYHEVADWFNKKRK